MTTSFYNKNANALADQYLSKSFEKVHQSWPHLLPTIHASSQSQYKLHQALNWLEPKRTTVEVRQRFEQLKQQSANTTSNPAHNAAASSVTSSVADIAQCVWFAKSLTDKYDIDHSMPFARWSNNDLWNLFPTDCKVNNQKNDRLPTELKLIESKERIQHWWQEAWLNDEPLTDRKVEPSASLIRAEPSAGLRHKQSQRFSLRQILPYRD